MTKIERAQEYAHEAHDSIKQVRKYTGQPYWIHTDEVAAIVAEDGGTENMVVAANLHDVLEDVYPLNKHYGPDWIIDNFGHQVHGYVLDLTDVYTKQAFPNLNRQKRKTMERLRIDGTSPEAKTIKLADLISNTQSIVEHDPDFAHVYLREKMELLGYLTEGSPRLLQRASMQALAGYQKLGLTIPTIVS